jgi:hypothetical protein
MFVLVADEKVDVREVAGSHVARAFSALLLRGWQLRDKADFVKTGLWTRRKLDVDFVQLIFMA